MGVKSKKTTENTSLVTADKESPPMADKQEEQNADNSLFSGLPEEYLSKLTPAKTRMIMLYLTGQYSQKKIGAIVGVSENTIHTWLVDPAVQAVISEIQNREFAVIESNLRALRYKAINTMNDLLDSVQDNVRYSAAKDILDRGGHRPQQSIKVDKTVTSVQQQLASLADFIIDDDEVIDVEPVEVK